MSQTELEQLKLQVDSYEGEQYTAAQLALLLEWPNTVFDENGRATQESADALTSNCFRVISGEMLEKFPLKEQIKIISSALTIYDCLT